jgi:CTP synthase (UTP-ammonia lyase)
MRIGIIGDFNPAFPSHHATNAAFQHVAARMQVDVETAWIPTPSLREPTADVRLSSFDGLLASPGSPYESMAGMLRGIEFARTRNWPFVGT